MSWVLILKLALLGYTVYSIIAYLSRRSDNRGAFDALRRTFAIRELDADEISALDPVRTAQKLGTSTEVRRLVGRYQRHGISTNGSETLHDTIGDVEVLLPYDAAHYLREDNEAEVVLSAKLAVAVRLNEFHVVEGRQRALRAQAQERAWQDGQTGPMRAIHEDAAASSSAPAPQADETEEVPTPSSEVTVLAQRKETPGEVALRTRPGLRWRASALWLLAFVLLWVAAWKIGAGVRWPLAILALASAAAGTWLFVRRSASDARPEAVNRVRGMFNAYGMVPAGNVAGASSLHLFLGDKLHLDMPEHWRSSDRLTFGSIVDMDVRARDRHVLGFGDGWSLEDEARRFPHVSWGRHLLLLSIGLLGLLIVSLHSDGLKQDLSTAVGALRSSELRSDSDAASLAARPPRAGDVVQISGSGHCELTPTEMADGTTVALADCSRMRWGGNALTISDIALPPSQRALQAGTFIEARENTALATLQRMMRMQAMLAAGGDSLSMPVYERDPPMHVYRIGAMVGLVEEACRTGLSDCDGFKRRLVDLFGLEIEQDDGSSLMLDSWEVFSREMLRLAEDGDDVVSLEKDTVQRIRAFASARVGSAVQQQLATQNAQLLAAQHGGVVFIAPTSLVADDDASGNILQRWQHTRDRVAHAVPFSISGRIVATEAAASGLRLTVDTEGDPERGGIAVVNSIALLLALALLATQLPLLIRTLRRARQRKAALQADLRQRPEPGSPQRF